MKRFISFLLVSLLCFSLFPVALAAPTEEEAMTEASLYQTTGSISFLTYNGTPFTASVIMHKYRNEATGQTQESPAYCIEPSMPGVSEVGYSYKVETKDYITNPKVYGILVNGYPYKTIGELGVASENEAYIATKTALWCYLQGRDINAYGARTSEYTRVLNAMKQIYAAGMAYTAIPEITLTVTPDSAAAAQDVSDPSFVSQTFSVSSNVEVKSYTVKFKAPASVPAGAVIADLNGTPKTEFAAGEKFKVMIPANSISGMTGTIDLDVTGAVRKNAIIYGKAYDATLQDHAVTVDPIGPKIAGGVVTFSQNETFIEITKLAEGTTRGLAGAVFEVEKIGGGVIGTFVTGGDGKVTVPLTEDGNYKVSELTPPENHLLSDPNYQIVSVVFGNTTKVSFSNKPFGTLHIYKRDSDGPLAGVVYRIAPVGNSAAYTDLVTDPLGFIGYTAAPGFYTITEQSTPDTHIIDEKTYTVEIVSGEITEQRFANLKKPIAVLEKTCSLSHNPLPGARFEAWYAGDSLSGTLRKLGEFVTDENGQIKITLEKSGWVRWIELEPPEGYALPDNPVTDIFVEAGTEKVAPVQNRPKSAIVVHKIDPENNTPIPDTWIRLRLMAGSSGTSGTVIAEKKTSVNGTCVFYNLNPGVYLVEEFRANDGYQMTGKTSETVRLSAGETVAIEVTLENHKKGGLILKKLNAADHSEGLAGAEFLITYADGRFVGDNNGKFTSGPDGLIVLDEVFDPGTVLIIREVRAPDGFVLSEEPRTVTIGTTTRTEVFYNKPLGNFTLIKSDEDRPTVRIAGAEFEISKVSGELVGRYKTDAQGRITLQLESGVYRAVELSVPAPYKVDGKEHIFTVEDGKAVSLNITNKAMTSVLIRKVCSVSGRGLPNVPFLLYDSTKRPILQVESDQDGYIWLPEGIDPGQTGRFYLRELKAPEGYLLNDQLITVYVLSGEIGQTKEILIKNTPILAQIQLEKLSADDNPRNGLPAGTPLPGAVYEVREYRTNTLMDTIKTDSTGRAVSKPLPLGRYVLVEIQAPDNYLLDPTPIEALLEHEGQIVKLRAVNRSVSLGVTVKKTGYAEVVPNQPIRYTITGIGNASSVPLDSFYVRDTLPQEVRLHRVITPTFNQDIAYKIIYKLNTGGGYRVLADNLSSRKVYVLDATPAALGLASNQYIVEVQLVFGRVQAGLLQIEPLYVDCTMIANIPHETRFVNQADVGGLHGGQWVQATSRWVTVVYNKGDLPTLPKTGY